MCLNRPLNLELTAANESVIIERLDVFNKNGFEFLIDEKGNAFLLELNFI